jgi:hypothetical protein
MLVWSFWPWAAQTVTMARKKTKPTRRTSKASKQTPARPEVQPFFPHLTAEERREFSDPVRHIDAAKALMKALEAAGIDWSKARQPDPLGPEWASRTTARTDHSEQMALAVTHAEDAKAVAAGHLASKHLDDDVKCTLYLRRGMQPQGGLQDARQPVIMDGEIVCLAGPEDDARSDLITMRLPRVVVERLRDAVHALAPRRTMAGIASLGISMVLDVLEAAHIRHEGRGFPRRPVQALEGGRPSRMRAVAPRARKPAKQARKK